MSTVWQGGAVTREFAGQDTCAVKWEVERSPLLTTEVPRDWSEFRTLKLQLYCPRRTAARVTLTAQGGKGEDGHSTTLAVDWVGWNAVELWLCRLAPGEHPGEWGPVTGVRLTCSEPGLEPTVLYVGELELTAAAPTWPVNESDTIINIGWRTDLDNPDEWQTTPETQVPSGQYGFKDSGAWRHFWFRQSQGKPGRLVHERKFDLDVSDYTEILGRMAWGSEAELTVTAIVDGEPICLVRDGTGVGDEEFQIFGSKLKGGEHLEAVRFELVEKPDAEFTDSEIVAGLFWLLLRRDIPEKLPHDRPDSATPIGDPEREGIPMGFYFTRERISELRRRAEQGTGAKVYQKIRAKADRTITDQVVKDDYYILEGGTLTPPPCGGGIGLPIGTCAASLRAYLPCVVLAHIISGEEKYAMAARRWLLRTVRSPDWGAEHGGRARRPGIGDRHGCWEAFTGRYPLGWGNWLHHPFAITCATYAVSLGYDYLYHCLSPAERKEIEEAIENMGIYWLYDVLRHRRAYYAAMNQGAFFCTALLMGATILARTRPNVRPIAQWAYEFLQDCATAALDDEGACHEGPNYGNNNVSTIISSFGPQSAYIGKPVQEIVSPSFIRGMDYLSQMRSTAFEKPSFLTINDYGKPYSWANSWVLAFFGGCCRQSVVRWYWNEIYTEKPPPDDLAFLYLDDNVPAAPPDLPPAKVFHNKAMAFLRTGWQYGETMLTLQCVSETYGHYHFDRNHVILEYNGETLLLDPGWKSEQYRDSRVHNTVTFSQGNQASDYQPGLRPHMTGFLSTAGDKCPGRDGAVDWIAADATAVYPQAGCCVRHVLFLRPGWFVLLDEVRAKEPAEIELNFNMPGEVSEQAGTFLMCTERNRLLIVPTATHTLTHAFGQWGTSIPGITDHRLILSPERPTDACDFLTVLAPYHAGGEAPMIERIGAESALGVRITFGEQVDTVVAVPDGVGQSRGDIRTDGRLSLIRREQGRLTAAALLNGTYLSMNGEQLITADRPMRAAMRATDLRLDLALSGEQGTHVTVALPAEWLKQPLQATWTPPDGRPQGLPLTPEQGTGRMTLPVSTPADDFGIMTIKPS